MQAHVRLFTRSADITAFQQLRQGSPFFAFLSLCMSSMSKRAARMICGASPNANLSHCELTFSQSSTGAVQPPERCKYQPLTAKPFSPPISTDIPPTNRICTSTELAVSHHVFLHIPDVAEPQLVGACIFATIPAPAGMHHQHQNLACLWPNRVGWALRQAAPLNYPSNCRSCVWQYNSQFPRDCNCRLAACMLLHSPAPLNPSQPLFPQTNSVCDLNHELSRPKVGFFSPARARVQPGCTGSSFFRGRPPHA